MKQFLILAVVVAVAVARRHNPLLDEHWELFKGKFGKAYTSINEESSRRLIWEGNVALIAKHNREYDLGKHTFNLGLNQYADLTNREFVEKMNGYKLSTRPRSNPVFQPQNKDVPDTVDWRSKNIVTDIKDQGQCGSCWAFSTTGSVEGQHALANGKLVSLSEQELVDCSQNEGNEGCNGGLMDQGFQYIIDNKGIDTEDSYPYEAEDDKCKSDPKNIGATIKGFVDVKSGSEDDLKQAVATVGPISVAIDASSIFFQLYRSGVYKDPFCSTTNLDHGVLAVGYGTDNKQDYWLVKNSWGTSWGMKGYIKMARNHSNMCGIATQASYPTV